MSLTDQISLAQPGEVSEAEQLQGTASFRAVFEELENSALTPQQKGKRFERLVLQYFRKDPYWSEIFSEVRLWNDWEDKPEGYPDLGVDIVGKFTDSLEGESDWAAIQCKFYHKSHKINAKAIKDFKAASEKSRKRIFVSTSELNRNAALLAEDSKPHLTHLNLGKLAQAKFQWATLAEQAEATDYVGETYTPRADQLVAISAVLRRFYGAEPDVLPDEWQQILAGVRSEDFNSVSPPETASDLADRGQMHMPCGTGKTFTALELAEQAAQLDPNRQEPFRVLYLMPSISLLQQNMREWAEQKQPGFVHKYIGVCSDRTAGKHRDDTIGDLTELEGEVTTDPAKIAQRLTKDYQDVDMVVVFSTYQSCQLVAEAQNPKDSTTKAAPDFDLIICDEAHRTSGIETDYKTQPTSNRTEPDGVTEPRSTKSPNSTLPADYGSKFLLPHDNSKIKARKRLYMTATPKVYTEGIKAKAKKAAAGIYSMDDPQKFGEKLYAMSFSQAIKAGLLSDYKVLAIFIDPTYKQQLIDEGILMVSKNDGLYKLELDGRAKAIGTVKAISGDGGKLMGNANGSEADEANGETGWQPLRRSIAFTNRVLDSKKYEAALPAAAARLNSFKTPDETPINLAVKHIDGTTKAYVRRQHLEWLADPELPSSECRLITNARCLSEGVDVPALDGALFMAPRHTASDVIQQVGRVMRKAKGKDCGYVVVPMLLEDAPTLEEAITKSSDYQTILKVVRALKSHDDEIVRLLNVRDLRDKIEVRLVTRDSFPSDDDIDEETKQNIQQQLRLTEQELTEAIKVGLYDSCSDKEYWKRWAQDIGEETQKLQKAIVRHLRQKPNKPLYDGFLENCQETISPQMSDSQAVGLLAQHLVTKPVFEALYQNYDFAENNPISKLLQPVCDEVIEAGLLTELHKKTEPFYESVRAQAEAASKQGAEARHELIKQLYETFIKTAMPDLAEQLGVVYTPVEIVDWLLRSADDVLRQEFGLKLEDEGVEILDPFSGTGTFLTRLIEMEHTHEDEPERTHLISTSKLPHKYRHELSAIEIVPTAYYISDINIEEAFHTRMSEVHGDSHPYVPFDGIALGNTLRLPVARATGQTFREQLFSTEDENTPQLNRIAQKDVRVIVGNPPWRAWQKTTTDNNPNDSHPEIDKLIEKTYASRTDASNKNALYDLYIKSLLWASHRIEDEGVIAFVTNGGWLDGNAAAGIRACLAEEFTSVHVYDLKGRIPGSPEDGGNVFEVKVPITMLLLVKNPTKIGQNKIFYANSKDRSIGQEKLEELKDCGSLEYAGWSEITPNEQHDWINQRDNRYAKYYDMGNDETRSGKSMSAIFKIYSRGLATGRDLWAYNSDRLELRDRSEMAVDFFHEQIKKGETSKPEECIEIIKWHDGSLNALKRKRQLDNDISIRMLAYRPFYPQYVHWEKGLNARHYQLDKIFPVGDVKNLTINVSGKGAANFDILMTGTPPPNIISCPDLNILGGGTQSFPRFTYESAESCNLRDGQNQRQGTLCTDDHHATRSGTCPSQPSVSTLAIPENRSNTPRGYL